MITEKQKRIFDFIRSYYSKNNTMPTISEIANAFGYSLSTVHEYLKKLTQKGYLIKKNYGWYEIAQEYLSWQVPFHGEISAGLPVSIWEEPIDFINVPLYTDCENCIALQVRGNSMIEDLIADGDFIIIEPKEDFINGETVVAIVDNDTATIKKIYRHKDLIELRPANSDMESQYYKPEMVRVVGKLKYLIRNY